MYLDHSIQKPLTSIGLKTNSLCNVMFTSELFLSNPPPSKPVLESGTLQMKFNNFFLQYRVSWSNKYNSDYLSLTRHIRIFLRRESKYAKIFVILA